jgi:hypothetical protein
VLGPRGTCNYAAEPEPDEDEPECAEQKRRRRPVLDDILGIPLLPPSRRRSVSRLGSWPWDWSSGALDASVKQSALTTRHRGER